MYTYVWRDTCMMNGYLFFMGVWIGISFWCVLKLSEWRESFFGNFWGPPNLSSNCDYNNTYVKHESFKTIIFGGYKIIKTSLKIHAKSLSDALAPFKKNACGAGLRQLCEASAFIAGVPIVCQIFARDADGMVSLYLSQPPLMMMGLLNIIGFFSSSLLSLTVCLLILSSVARAHIWTNAYTRFALSLFLVPSSCCCCYPSPLSSPYPVFSVFSVFIFYHLQHKPTPSAAMRNVKIQLNSGADDTAELKAWFAVHNASNLFPVVLYYPSIPKSTSAMFSRISKDAIRSFWWFAFLACARASVLSLHMWKFEKFGIRHLLDLAKLDQAHIDELNKQLPQFQHMEVQKFWKSLKNLPEATEVKVFLCPSSAYVRVCACMRVYVRLRQRSCQRLRLRLRLHFGLCSSPSGFAYTLTCTHMSFSQELQCVAVCCHASQCVAAFSCLQCLQCGLYRVSGIPCICSAGKECISSVAMRCCCSVLWKGRLQQVHLIFAVYCSVLQCVVMCCSILQWTVYFVYVCEAVCRSRRNISASVCVSTFYVCSCTALWTFLAIVQPSLDVSHTLALTLVLAQECGCVCARGCSLYLILTLAIAFALAKALSGSLSLTNTHTNEPCHRNKWAMSYIWMALSLSKSK